jgi:hypothetical protein
MSKNRLEAFSDGVIAIQNTPICALILDECRITAGPQIGGSVRLFPTKGDRGT